MRCRLVSGNLQAWGMSAMLNALHTTPATRLVVFSGRCPEKTRRGWILKMDFGASVVSGITASGHD